MTLYTFSSSKPEIAKIVFSEKQYIYSIPELVVPIMISLIEDCHYPHNEAADPRVPNCYVESIASNVSWSPT
jgi:hypothetical protein